MSKDHKYMEMAQVWAGNSHSERKKVGALIVKDQMIISDGYNGMPSGFPNECEDELGNTRPEVLHAEANAITKVAKSTNNAKGSTLYVTLAPCLECAKLIIQSEIAKVIYRENYRDASGLLLLKKAGIEIEKIFDKFQK